MIFEIKHLSDPIEQVVTIAVVNFHAMWGKKQNNLERIMGYIEAAAKQGANIIVFPEMALTGYDNDLKEDKNSKMQYLNAEVNDGESIHQVADLTKKLGVYAVVGYPERDKEISQRIFNSAFVTGPDGIIGSYEKIHVCVREVLWAKKGRKPFLFDSKWGKIGVSICGDTYNYHELTRYYAAQGARILINPTAVLNTDSWDFASYFTTGLESITMINDVYVASANFTGPEVVSDGAGCSNLIGPALHGSKYWYAGSMEHSEEGIFMETIDLSLVNHTIFKENKWNGEPDYRPEIYKKTYDTILQESNYYIDTKRDEVF